jgi:hypothetical protein
LSDAVAARDALETARASAAFKFHLDVHLAKEDAHLYRLIRERVSMPDQGKAIGLMASTVPQDRFPEVVAWMFPLLGHDDRENKPRLADGHACSRVRDGQAAHQGDGDDGRAVSGASYIGVVLKELPSTTNSHLGEVCPAGGCCANGARPLVQLARRGSPDRPESGAAGRSVSPGTASAADVSAHQEACPSLQKRGEREFWSGDGGLALKDPSQFAAVDIPIRHEIRPTPPFRLPRRCYDCLRRVRFGGTMGVVRWHAASLHLQIHHCTEQYRDGSFVGLL